MNQKEAEKNEGFIANRDNLFEVVVVIYSKPDKGRRKLDYIVGPFPTDAAALFWVQENKHFIGKGIPEYELSIRPE